MNKSNANRPVDFTVKCDVLTSFTDKAVTTPSVLKKLEQRQLELMHASQSTKTSLKPKRKKKKK